MFIESVNDHDMFCSRVQSNTPSIRVLRNRPTSMNEQCKSTIVLDLQIFNYIEQVSSDVSQLPRTHVLVVLS